MAGNVRHDVRVHHPDGRFDRVHDAGPDHGPPHPRNHRPGRSDGVHDLRDRAGQRTHLVRGGPVIELGARASTVREGLLCGRSSLAQSYNRPWTYLPARPGRGFRYGGTMPENPADPLAPKYRRVLLKLSGDAFG